MSQWHDTILERYGEQWILDKARKGGQAKVPKGFAKSGLASEAGRKGGLVSKRKPSRETPNQLS